MLLCRNVSVMRRDVFGEGEVEMEISVKSRDSSVLLIRQVVFRQSINWSHSRLVDFDGNTVVDSA